MVSRRRLAPHKILATIALAGLGACAGIGGGALPEPEEPIVGWEVMGSEYISLWYHSLAYTDGAGGAERGPLPRFEPGYVERMTEIKRREGRYPSPLDSLAAEFARTFETSAAYEGLEFLPLYFRSAEALYSGIDLWNRADGNPQNTPVVEAVRIIAFLSSLFPRRAERQAVVDWVELIRAEESAFYRTHWAAISTPLSARAAEVQREWEALEPKLRDYLRFIRYRSGEIFLVPALGPEGRSVAGEGGSVRIAILMPPAGRPEEAIWSIVHELLYPLVDDIINEFVAPAKIRELGEARLASTAALRGGAILLEQIEPSQVDAYRSFFLTSIGESRHLTGEVLRGAFESAFPIPAELVPGLEEGIELALAGI